MAGLRSRKPCPGSPSATTGLPRALELITVVVAPTTLATALMFYFGWSHAYWYCHYFGVESTMLGFTTADYLMRSVDGLFIPLVTGAVLLLIVVALAQRLVSRVDESRARERVARVARGLGIGLVLLGVINAVGVHVLDRPPLPALALALGAPIALVGARTARRETELAGGARPPSTALWVSEWALAFLLVALGLFWAAADYSASVGTARARATAARLAVQPSVVLYSSKSLALQSSGVGETLCPGAEAAYRFRYDGLVLILQSGNQLFLLPRGWNEREGTAIVLARGDSTRLEFGPANAAPRPGPVTCS